MSNKVNLGGAIQAWRRAIGEKNVVLRKHELDAKASATYAVRHVVTAIVRPGTREEVQECVRIAARNRVPIYPISGGQNIGYGSAAPTHDSAIFDLARLDHMALDRERATLTVGPGVHSPDVARYVAKHAPELVASLPVQTSPRSSPVGNALDGGIGFGLFADRALSAFSIEAVLGTGEVIHTGMDRFQGGELLGHTEARLGPSLRDLFIQSNFGIVTSITFGLFPMPGDLRRLTVELKSADEAGRVVEQLRPLVRAGVIDLPYSLNNESGVAQAILNFEYPWTFSRGRTPLPNTVFRDLKRMGWPTWRVAFNLWSHDRGIGEARERAIRLALKGFPMSKMNVRDVRQFILPDGFGLRAMYWGKQIPAPLKPEDIDPYRDKCGFIWADFSMHEDPKLMLRMVSELEPLVRSYGFEPSLQIHTVWPRALFIIVGITYDREVPDADLRAERCEEAMAEFFAERGILPARRRIATMHHIPPTIDDYAAVYGRVKAAFDPKRIISPGRYERTAAPGPLIGVKSHYDFVEKAHRSIIEDLNSARRRMIAKKPGPLRAHYMDARQYAAVRDAAKLLVPAFVAAGNALLDRDAWTKLLGVDERLVPALRRNLDRRPPSGRIEGVFDHFSGAYRVLGFDPSLDGLQRQASARGPRVTSGVASRTTAAARFADEIGRRVAYGKHAETASIAHLAKSPVVMNLANAKLSDEKLAKLGVDYIHAVGWKKILKSAGARRVVVEDAPKTNAVEDLVLGNLVLFALLTDSKQRPRLPKNVARAVDEHLPWTRVCRRGPTHYRGKVRDLQKLLESEQASFVLRTAEHSGSGPLVGEFTSPAAWKRAVRHAMAGRSVVVAQERVKIHHEVFPLARVGGAVEFEGCFVGTDALLLGGHFMGCATRISETPEVGARSGSSQSVETFVDGRT